MWLFLLTYVREICQTILKIISSKKHTKIFVAIKGPFGWINEIWKILFTSLIIKKEKQSESILQRKDENISFSTKNHKKGNCYVLTYIDKLENSILHDPELSWFYDHARGNPCFGKICRFVSFRACRIVWCSQPNTGPAEAGVPGPGGGAFEPLYFLVLVAALRGNLNSF